MKTINSILILGIIFVVYSCCHSNTGNLDSNPRKHRLEEHVLRMEKLSENNPSRIHSEHVGLENLIFTISISDSSYWDNVTPLKFIDTLSKYHDGFQFIVETSPHQKWMKKKSSEELLALLLDTTACATVIKPCVFETMRGFDSNCRSTIGKEVKFMLSCFEMGNYPKCYSSCLYLDKEK